MHRKGGDSEINGINIRPSHHLPNVGKICQPAFFIIMIMKLVSVCKGYAFNHETSKQSNETTKPIFQKVLKRARQTKYLAQQIKVAQENGMVQDLTNAK